MCISRVFLSKALHVLHEIILMDHLENSIVNITH